MLAFAHFFSFSGCDNHARSKLVPLGITEKKKKGNALINWAKYDSICRTYPVLGITHSGFLYRSIHHIPTENQVLHV